MHKIVTPQRPKKERKTAAKAHELGVCLTGKRDSKGKRVSPVCSGFLAKGLKFQLCSEKLFIITVANIASSKGEDIGIQELKDCVLYFKDWKSDKPKQYELHKIAKNVTIRSGLAVISLDIKKNLGGRFGKSGLETYRPILVQKDVTEHLGGSICQIVEGNMDNFAVETYNLEHVNGEYVLFKGKFPGDRGDSFKTLKELYAGRGGSNFVHPHGAVILREQKLAQGSMFSALGVLNFDLNDKITPVSLGESWRGGGGGVARVNFC